MNRTEMCLRAKIYFKWLMAGFPIMGINYFVFMIASQFVPPWAAYFSWILVSPLTYEICAAVMREEEDGENSEPRCDKVS